MGKELETLGCSGPGWPWHSLEAHRSADGTGLPEEWQGVREGESSRPAFPFSGVQGGEEHCGLEPSPPGLESWFRLFLYELCLYKPQAPHL